MTVNSCVWFSGKWDWEFDVCNCLDLIKMNIFVHKIVIWIGFILLIINYVINYKRYAIFDNQNNEISIKEINDIRLLIEL